MNMIIHDKGIVLFFVFLPMVYPIIYSLIYNPELVRDVKMVVVDDDRTQQSRDLTRRFDASQGVAVLGYATDINDARKAMNSHDCYAIMQIPAGYGRSINGGKSAPVVLYVDMSLLLRYRSVLMSATEIQETIGAEIQQANINDLIPSGSSIVTGNLMPITHVNMGDITGGFDSFIMPGVIIFILHQCIVLAVGMMGGVYRERPELYPINPMRRHQHIFASMIARMLCCFTIMLAPTLYIIHYVPLIFSFPMTGDLWQILAFLTPMIICCVFLGDCLQSIVRQREDIFVIWVATSVLLLFLSGLTWPRFAMAPIWKFIGSLFPATWAMEGFVKMNSNSATLSQVSNCYIMEWILCIAWGIAAYLLQRFVVLKDVRISYIKKLIIRKQLHKDMNKSLPNEVITATKTNK